MQSGVSGQLDTASYNHPNKVILWTK